MSERSSLQLIGNFMFYILALDCHARKSQDMLATTCCVHLSRSNDKPESKFDSLFYFVLLNQGIVENIPSLTFTHHAKVSLYLGLLQVKEAALSGAFQESGSKIRSTLRGLEPGT